MQQLYTLLDNKDRNIKYTGGSLVSYAACSRVRGFLVAARICVTKVFHLDGTDLVVMLELSCLLLVFPEQTQGIENAILLPFHG